MFSSLGPYSQVLGQMMEWLKLELNKLKRLSSVVTFAVVFSLFYKQGWQGGVFKIIKNDDF